jgi:hypothetical protein
VARRGVTNGGADAPPPGAPAGGEARRQQNAAAQAKRRADPIKRAAEQKSDTAARKCVVSPPTLAATYKAQPLHHARRTKRADCELARPVLMHHLGTCCPKKNAIGRRWPGKTAPARRKPNTHVWARERGCYWRIR